MQQSHLPAYQRPGANQFTIKRLTGGLLSLGLCELGIWLFSCLNAFYAGNRLIVLPVQASAAFAQTHRPLSQYITTSAGAYSSGATGELLYHASSLGDFLLFYTLGDLTSLDALFFAGLGIYLYWTLRRLPVGHEFTPAASRAMEVIGIATVCMFILKMMLAIVAAEVFWAKTNHLFRLAANKSGGSIYYAVFGFLLVVCAAFFRRGQQLQHDADLTI